MKMISWFVIAFSIILSGGCSTIQKNNDLARISGQVAVNVEMLDTTAKNSAVRQEICLQANLDCGTGGATRQAAVEILSEVQYNLAKNLAKEVKKNEN